MPNRIIRESALTSHSLATLSDGAERLFWRLTVVADDHGRFDAYPSTVKSKCFPTIVDHLKTERVRLWLIELGVDHCIYYTVGTRPYGQFRKWAEYQRSYGLASKFPQPPADCGNSPQSPALILIRETRDERRETRYDIGHQGVTEFDQFYEAYPRHVGKKAARKAWDGAKDRPSLEAILLAIAAQKKSHDWTKDGGQYIPHPSTWLNQGRWSDQPTQRQPTVMEKFLSRHQEQA